MLDIRNVELIDISNYLKEKGDKPFRAKQIWHWIWKKGANDFEQMPNIPQSTKKLLDANFFFHRATITQKQKSIDGTIKVVFQLFDNKTVEGVLIPAGKRMTACISSQVGCALGCEFCATAKLHLSRNLSVGEIFDQVVAINKLANENQKKSLSNIVYMGMGEPLLNYKNVLTSIKHITSETGLAMSNSRITLSTAGIHNKIISLADENVKFNLAISLHSAIDDVRNSIMPINRKGSNLKKLSEAIQYFHRKTGKRVTLEYLLLSQINDSIDDARALAEYCKDFPCKINLIEYNPIGDEKYKKSSKQKSEAFVSYLEQKNMIVNFRASKGEDIDAACGQLANKLK